MSKVWQHFKFKGCPVLDKLEHYNAMVEDAVAAATEGVKAIGKAGQKAADTAKAAASNAANNNVKSAATAEVAAIQAKVEAAFKEKLGLVYAMGGGVGEGRRANSNNFTFSKK